MKGEIVVEERWEKTDYLALDASHEVVAWDPTSEGARLKAIKLGIENPVIIPALYVESGLIQLEGFERGDETEETVIVEDLPEQHQCQCCNKEANEWWPSVSESIVIIALFIAIVIGFFVMVYYGHFPDPQK